MLKERKNNKQIQCIWYKSFIEFKKQDNEYIIKNINLERTYNANRYKYTIFKTTKIILIFKDKNNDYSQNSEVLEIKESNPDLYKNIAIEQCKKFQKESALLKDGKLNKIYEIIKKE